MARAWDVVADALGFGPSGNDHASSNWAAWGHEEICSMLQTSVDPADIDDAARAWRQQGSNTTDAITGLTRDLQAIVFDGWRGASADAALTALGPINQWSADQADTADRTTRLMDDSASSTAQAKSAVPPPVSHDWGESLRSFSIAGGVGVFVDAVAQEQQKVDAHAEAVRVMTTVYSAPINDHQAAVPTYPQLADPTMQPPEQPADSGPVPGTLYPLPGAPPPGQRPQGERLPADPAAGDRAAAARTAAVTWPTHRQRPPRCRAWSATRHRSMAPRWPPTRPSADRRTSVGRSPRLRRQPVFRSWRRSPKVVSGGLWRLAEESESAVPGLAASTRAVAAS